MDRLFNAHAYRNSVVSALRQALEAGVRYGYLTQNPAKVACKNPQPKPRTIRVYTADELGRITAELGAREAAAVRFAAATGLRPAEWAHLERRGIDRVRRVLMVEGTKTIRSRREVPLSVTALHALDSFPPRIDSPFVLGRDDRGARRHTDRHGARRDPLGARRGRRRNGALVGHAGRRPGQKPAWILSGRRGSNS